MVNGWSVSTNGADDGWELAPIERLNRDLNQAAGGLTRSEARVMVDAYYTIQEHRIAATNQVRALSRAAEPHATLGWFVEQYARLEENLKQALDRYSQQSVVGAWSRSIVGIGPVLAAALLAHIDIARCPTVGKLWRFAGLDPTVVWRKGEKRPWNAQLKLTYWRIGDSFVRQQHRANDVYGHVYAKRKQYEWRRNLAGELADQAQHALATKRIRPTTEAYAWYSGQYAVPLGTGYDGATPTLPKGAAGTGVPMLPPAQIDMRARRYAVKLFLSAWHEVAWWERFETLPPKPYAIEHLGHVDYWQVPNLELVPGLLEAKRHAGQLVPVAGDD